MHELSIQIQFEQVVLKWKDRVARVHGGSIIDVEDTAWQIVNDVAGDDHWEEWYRSDQLFAEVFDLAAKLETGDGPVGYRLKQWKRIESLVAKLESKYVSKR